MSDFIYYSIQTICIQLVFLIVYQLLFAKETFFNWNRVYLLGSFTLALILPILNIPLVKTQDKVIQLKEIIITNNVSEQFDAVSKNFILENYLIEIAYFIGLLVFAFFFIVKIIRLFIVKRSTKIENHQGIRINVIPNSNQAFSFLNFIFIGEKNKDFDTILQHELIHKSKKHSLDLILVEITKIIFWFNPLLYVYQNKLAEVHEFEADASSLSLDKKKYYETIINQIFQVENITFTNNFFNQSLIKKRIVMLQKSKSKKIGMAKYVVVIPVVMLLFSVFSTKAIAQEKESKNNQEDFVPFAVIDQIPTFEGCENLSNENAKTCFNEKMNQHIKKYFTYPEQAVKKNIQGKVIITFIIDKEGLVKDISAKGVDENSAILEGEAKKIVSLLPKFTPGKHEGKKVNVQYSLPLTYRLQ